MFGPEEPEEKDSEKQDKSWDDAAAKEQGNDGDDSGDSSNQCG